MVQTEVREIKVGDRVVFGWPLPMILGIGKVRYIEGDRILIDSDFPMRAGGWATKRMFFLRAEIRHATLPEQLKLSRRDPEEG